MVFTDYCRPSIRLSALMGIRVIYVMTHDLIGLGEDGPTHQPVEHLLAPARPSQPAGAAPRRRHRDGGMLADLAGVRSTMPSVLALTRQVPPTVRDAGDENLCAKRRLHPGRRTASAPIRLSAAGP